MSIEGRTKVRILIPNSLSTEELTLSNSGVEEDSWESLECKDIKPVNPKRNKSWIFFERTDAEAETPNTFVTWCEEPTH